MQTMLWFLVGVTIFLIFYAVFLRPRIRQTAWGKRFLNKIEPVERSLWWNSETILVARSTMALGGLLTFLTQLGTLDITPLLPLLKEQHRPILQAIWNLLPLVITVLGWIVERLRKDTTRPLEVVAMRTDAPVEAQIAAEEAVAANARAVELAK